MPQNLPLSEHVHSPLTSGHRECGFLPAVSMWSSAPDLHRIDPTRAVERTAIDPSTAPSPSLSHDHALQAQTRDSCAEIKNHRQPADISRLSRSDPAIQPLPPGHDAVLC